MPTLGWLTWGQLIGKYASPISRVWGCLMFVHTSPPPRSMTVGPAKEESAAVPPGHVLLWEVGSFHAKCGETRRFVPYPF